MATGPRRAAQRRRPTGGGRRPASGRQRPVERQRPPCDWRGGSRRPAAIGRRRTSGGARPATGDRLEKGRGPRRRPGGEHRRPPRRGNSYSQGIAPPAKVYSVICFDAVAFRRGRFQGARAKLRRRTTGEGRRPNRPGWRPAGDPTATAGDKLAQRRGLLANDGDRPATGGSAAATDRRSGDPPRGGATSRTAATSPRQAGRQPATGGDRLATDERRRRAGDRRPVGKALFNKNSFLQQLSSPRLRLREQHFSLRPGLCKRLRLGTRDCGVRVSTQKESRKETLIQRR